ncbi:hypothetical protein C1645_826394, partial [Glomus cerebriforme]
DEKEDLTDNNKSKKIKSNNYKVKFSYTQRNYIANDNIEDEEISNNPNLHSNDQNELEIPEGHLKDDINLEQHHISYESNKNDAVLSDESNKHPLSYKNNDTK